MDLVQEVKVPDFCRSVCCDEDNTYVGLYDGSIARIDSRSYRLQPSFISSCGGDVFSAALYNGRLFTNSVSMNVYKMNGGFITSWKTGNKYYMAIVGGRIVSAGSDHMRLSVHNLLGHLIKHVSSAVLG